MKAYQPLLTMRASILLLSFGAISSGLHRHTLQSKGILNFSLASRLVVTAKAAQLLVRDSEVDVNILAYMSIGGTNHELDLNNPSNLGQHPIDSGIVPNLKWSFSDSKTRILKGGWVREQVVTDLPQSKHIAGAQQHLSKGAIRELHWHKVVSLDF